MATRKQEPSKVVLTTTRRRHKTVPTYPGPSQAEVEALSDEKVSEELLRLKIEPHTLSHVEDDELLIAAHGEKDYGHKWTKHDLKELRQQVYDWHHRCLKDQLLSGYMAEWITSLSEDACWMIVEEFEQKKIALSERRYTSRDQLRRRAGWAVYASECQNNQPREIQ
ncbi:MAG: hypothetical protein NDI90_04310 [Nitrospira sp. BO4]|jgi:hypothetical protein|nr:hypothetical protein [Nitrospira sp. BO4]